MSDFENKDFWPIEIDLDEAQRQFDNYLKEYQLEQWRAFVPKLQTALQEMDIPKVKCKRLSISQINSVLENPELKQRFFIQYINNCLYFIRREHNQNENQ